MVTAVYPGTFDPLTRGHEDLVRRASGLFDKLIVGVADSKAKRPFFSLEERLDIAHEVLGHYPNVQVESFSGLLKDFVRRHDARVIVRGLEAASRPPGITQGMAETPEPSKVIGLPLAGAWALNGA